MELLKLRLHCISGSTDWLNTAQRNRVGPNLAETNVGKTDAVEVVGKPRGEQNEKPLSV